MDHTRQNNYCSYFVTVVNLSRYTSGTVYAGVRYAFQWHIV